MVTIEKTIDIPADRRLRLDLQVPETVPSGKTSVVLVFPASETYAAAKGGPAAFPSISELKKEAERKRAERLADPSGDSLQKYCGSLQGVFDSDGLTIQRSMRDEWPD